MKLQKVRIPYFSCPHNIPLCKFTTVLFFFLIHSSPKRDLGCFQIVAILCSTAMYIRVHKFIWIGVSRSLEYIPSNRITGSKDSSIFFLNKFHTVLFRSSTKLHLHQQCTRVLFFSTFSPILVICWFTDNSHSDRYELISLCGFNLHLSYFQHFFICLWAICVSSLENCLFGSSVHLLITLFVFLVLSPISS